MRDVVGRTQQRAGHPQREDLRGHVFVESQLVGADDGVTERVHGGRGGVLHVQHDGHAIVEVNARGYGGTMDDFVGCGGGGRVGRRAGSRSYVRLWNALEMTLVRMKRRWRWCLECGNKNHSQFNCVRRNLLTEHLKHTAALRIRN